MKIILGNYNKDRGTTISSTEGKYFYQDVSNDQQVFEVYKKFIDVAEIVGFDVLQAHTHFKDTSDIWEIIQIELIRDGIIEEFNYDEENYCTFPEIRDIIDVSKMLIMDKLVKLPMYHYWEGQVHIGKTIEEDPSRLKLAINEILIKPKTRILEMSVYIYIYIDGQRKIIDLLEDFTLDFNYIRDKNRKLFNYINRVIDYARNNVDFPVNFVRFQISNDNIIRNMKISDRNAEMLECLYMKVQNDKYENKYILPLYNIKGE
ncbi:hypothetical protein INTERNEXUS_115 [Bacillus phage vB_BspM_Internexus]|nr:hypothetical protein INTERNEXUS_115 [Bacillus phage vB_BspM_Internexus]